MSAYCLYKYLQWRIEENSRSALESAMSFGQDTEFTNRSLPVLNGSLILWWALHTVNLLKARADGTATLRLFWFSPSAWKTIKLTARWEWPVESYSLLSFAWEEMKIQRLKNQKAGRQCPERDGMEDHKDSWVSFLQTLLEFHYYQ